MSSGVVGAAATIPPPARGSSPVLAKAIPCPLCGYDLRGLPAGRCPECGHAFDPEALIRAAELRHPYLFEDHAGRFWWSVPATLIGSLRPRRFWTLLRPEQPPKARLVIGYWLLVLVVCGLVALAVQISLFFAGGSISRWSDLSRQVSALNTAIERYETAGEPYRRAMDSQQGGDWVGTMSAARNQTVASNVLWILGMTDNYNPVRRLWPFAAVLVLWAWGVMLVLQVFRRTLRKARIAAGQILRVSLYAGDALPLVLLSLVLIGVWVRGRDLSHINDLANWQYVSMVLAEAIFVACVALFSGWRLWRAQLHYLRLPQGIATIVAIEAILALAAFIFLLNVRFALLNYI